MNLQNGSPVPATKQNCQSWMSGGLKVFICQVVNESGIVLLVSKHFQISTVVPNLTPATLLWDQRWLAFNTFSGWSRTPLRIWKGADPLPSKMHMRKLYHKISGVHGPPTVGPRPPSGWKSLLYVINSLWQSVNLLDIN